jgi:hypothetical protein
MGRGGNMMKNEIHFRVCAEDRIRARLLEAENYQMLNQLRTCYPRGFSFVWWTLTEGLARSLSGIAKKLEGFEASLVTWFEFEGKAG